MSCTADHNLIKVAESDRPLFGKIKFWEIEQLSARLYAFRYTFYRNIIIVGDDGIIVTDPLTPEAAGILNTEIKICIEFNTLNSYLYVDYLTY